MKADFFKFPTTPHLAAPDGVDLRGDKVLPGPERDDFLANDLVIEEKVDGANLGISFDSEGNIRAQNRGSYLHLPGTGQCRESRVGSRESRVGSRGSRVGSRGSRVWSCVLRGRKTRDSRLVTRDSRPATRDSRLATLDSRLATLDSRLFITAYRRERP